MPAATASLPDPSFAPNAEQESDSDMIRMRHALLSLAAGVLLLPGCGPAQHNITAALLKDKPRLRVEVCPHLAGAPPETFSMVPASTLKKEPVLNHRVMSMQLLFFLRNALEFRGYRYVRPEAYPDMLVVIGAGGFTSRVLKLGKRED